MRFRAVRGGRADKVVAEQWPTLGRRALARLFDDGLVRVGGKRARKGDPVAPGAELEVALDASDAGDPRRPIPEPDAPLTVLHEDARLVVLAKAPGQPSHPLRAGERSTLANAIAARFPECIDAGDDPREAGLAHRLDAGTSGVLVAARDAAAWRLLRQAFHEGAAKKRYLALVVGIVDGAGEIDAPIAHDRPDRRRARVCVDDEEALRLGALPARTRYVPVERLGDTTLVACEMQTGRMHQVRVHLAHQGWPLVGDELYGAPSVAAAAALVGHFLHAEQLELPHPDGGVLTRWAAPLPADREAVLAALRLR